MAWWPGGLVARVLCCFCCFLRKPASSLPVSGAPSQELRLALACNAFWKAGLEIFGHGASLPLPARVPPRAELPSQISAMLMAAIGNITGNSNGNSNGNNNGTRDGCPVRCPSVKLIRTLSQRSAPAKSNTTWEILEKRKQRKHATRSYQSAVS